MLQKKAKTMLVSVEGKLPEGVTAKDIILARKLMPVVLERTQSAFGNDAPIYNAAGLTMFISIMPPGQGPCLHAHVKTFETFIVLEGKLEFSLNDDGDVVIAFADGCPGAHAPSISDCSTRSTWRRDSERSSRSATMPLTSAAATDVPVVI
mgnify:CR=1 FL=1